MVLGYPCGRVIQSQKMSQPTALMVCSLTSLRILLLSEVFLMIQSKTEALYTSCPLIPPPLVFIILFSSPHWNIQSGGGGRISVHVYCCFSSN